MKIIRLAGVSGNKVWLVAASILFFFVSCATNTPFLTSSVLPAARGSVNVKQDKNNNYVIKLEVSNLAEPGRLQPPRKTYVVWMNGEGGVTKNLGQIQTSSNVLSKSLKAAFEAVSPVKPTKVFLTPEDDATVQAPTSDVVLSTDNF